MLRSALAASAILALAAATSALASHPEHVRSLGHHAEPHLTSRHAQPHHASAHLAHLHTRPSHHPAAHRAALVTSGRHHGALSHTLRHVALHSSEQIAQPRHLSARAERAELARRQVNPARLTPVVVIARPAGAPRPQLPPIAEAVTEPLALPHLYNEHGRLLMPAALVGSHAILLHQNEMADQDGLGRIQDDADLDAMRARGMLVALPAGPGLAVDPRLPYNRRYARPWTTQFLSDLSHDYYRRFHTPLQLTSAVRTVEFQQQLMHRNGNAAPADGDTASPHLTGQAIDLGKHGMSLPQIAWMRGYLLPLIQSGKIDVEEEFKQSCFHISVYRAYTPPLSDHYSIASRGTSTSLAAVLP